MADKNIKKDDEARWQDEYMQLYEQLGNFINRGDFSKHGMWVDQTPYGTLELYVDDINDSSWKDGLRFEIAIARDGVKDEWFGVQWRDNRAGYFVSVIRTHPTKGTIELTHNERVDGGFRSLTAFIRKYVTQYEEEVRAENNSGLGFSSPGDFEDWSLYASTKKSKSFNEMVKEQRKQYKNKKVL